MRALVLAVLLAGCAQTPLIECPQFEIPQAPVLPTVSEAELAHVDEDVYERLAQRELLRYEYQLELLAELEGLKQGCDQ